MKKFVCTILTAAIAATAVTLPVNAVETDRATETVQYNYDYDAGTGYTSEGIHTRKMEKLDRGLVAIKTDSGIYLSWRLFDSEDALFGSADSNVSFNVYRGSEKIAAVSDKTNYIDTTAGTSYSVAPVINGEEGEKCEAVTVNSGNYFDIPLSKPADETIYDTSGNELYKASFFPADCSTGDLDGDGEYEIIVKWTSMEKDVGSPGSPEYSGTVHLAAYKLDGTKMWQNDIELGKNVYSSAHTVQFLVYDFDMDGKAEMMCQTSLGSKDASGAYVSHSAKADSVIASTGVKIAEFTDDDNAKADYRGGGRIVTGEEFLTVFNGQTGVAIDTIDLPTTRGSANGVDYGDDFGNRSNRFVADVAYLDGEKPYAIYLRGYYFGKNGKQRTSIAGISFDGEKLSPDYRFDTQQGQPGYYDGAYNYVGNGNHNCTVADVDNDGKDEFITGALCMEADDNNQFRPRWCTFREHGDALHIGDYDPTHPGFEFFTVHEDGWAYNKVQNGNSTSYVYSGDNIKTLPDGSTKELDYGMTVIDADTGEELYHVGRPKTYTRDPDTGRGVMANTGSGGYYQITGVDSYQCNGGTNFTPTQNGAGSNFRIFWDGDLYDNLLDGTSVTDWNGRSMSEIFNAGSYDCVKINGTKSNPALQADLFGDWREELVYPTTDGTKLRVFTTTTPTEYKIKTLMHDPVYRSGVAAEQTAYNQPPHIGFYIDEDTFAGSVTEITITSQPDQTTYELGESFNPAGMVVTASFDTGITREISAYEISGYNPDKAGSQTVTVSYKGKSAAIDVYVKTISGIIITDEPAKKDYKVGVELDLTGMIVSAQYDNGETKILAENDYTVSGFDKYASGEQTVTVDYKGYTAEFTTNTPVDFTIDDEGYITGYTGSDTIVVCPSSINGVAIRGFEYKSLTSSAIDKMYFYHEPIYFTGLNNVFPSDMTVVCYKNSTVHKYAVKHNMNVEFIEMSKTYANITVDESEYDDYNVGDAIVYQHDKQAWTTPIPPVTYGVGARSNQDGGDGYTGIYKAADSDNNYLEAKAGQFSTVNRHAYIAFDNADDLNVSGQYNLSFDFCIPANNSNMTIAVTSNTEFANGRGDFGTDENTIFALQNGKDNIEADTWYHYELKFENGAYNQTITNKTTDISISPAVNMHATVKAICFPSSGTSRGSSVSAYIDNINLYSEVYSNLNVTVTDNIGTLIEGATVTLGDLTPVTTDENGRAAFNNIPGGAYTAIVSYGDLANITKSFILQDQSMDLSMSFNEKIEILSTLTVNVTDANNLPVTNAVVMIQSNEDSEDTEEHSAFTQSASTDKTGQALFENVPNGSYSIVVDYKDWDTVTSSVNIIKKTSSANVKMADALTYRPLSLSSDKKSIIFELAGTDNVRVFAAKYDDNHILTNMIEIKKLYIGENTVKVASLGFTPDRLFIWNNDLVPLSAATEFETAE